MGYNNSPLEALIMMISFTLIIVLPLVYGQQFSSNTRDNDDDRETSLVTASLWDRSSTSSTTPKYQHHLRDKAKTTTPRSKPPPSDIRYTDRRTSSTTTRELPDLVFNPIEYPGWWTTTTTTTTEIPPRPIEDPFPSVLIRVESGNKDVRIKWDEINLSWKASIEIRNLREIKVLAQCNASHPIEWVSPDPYGTAKLELNEYRYFVQNNPDYVIYSIILTLKYDKGDEIPSRILVTCSPLGPSQKQTFLNLTKSSERLHFEVTKFDNSRWSSSSSSSSTSPIVEVELMEYSQELGMNAKCDLRFEWRHGLGNFICFADFQNEPKKLTIDYDDKCQDFATCRRRFRDRDHCDRFGGSGSGGGLGRERFNARREESPSNLWQKSDPPLAGLVFCKAEGNLNLNESVAKRFFHSLPPLCPGDRQRGVGSMRNTMYVTDFNTRPDLSELKQNFISFCPTSHTNVQADSTTPRSRNSNDNPQKTYYVGENITVSCFSSVYHFAEGIRLKSKTGSREDYLNMSNPTVERINRGIYNFTGTVRVYSAEVQELICESFLKRSTDSVSKSLRIQVKAPVPIRFTGGLTQLAQYLYSGQPDFELRCEAEGDPIPSIRWKKQGRPIPPEIKEVTYNSVSILKFPEVMEHRNGIPNWDTFFGPYSCVAYNGLDQNERIFHVSPGNSSNLPVVIDTEGNIIVPQAKEEDEGDSTLLLVGIVIPLLLVLAGVVIAFLMWKIKRQKKKLSALSKAEVDEFILGKPEFLQHHSSSEEVNNYAPYLPYNRSYEIGKDQLELEEDGILGSGAYAVVLKGKFHHQRGNGGQGGEYVDVAVKTARPMDDMSYFKALLSELKIMGFIGTHPNIVNLVGAHTKNIRNREVFIAIEFCSNGNLLDYLRNNRSRFKNFVQITGHLQHDMISPDSVANFMDPSTGILSNLTLMKWSLDVATGMEFLSTKKVIHGDLAARNILLSTHLVAKIGDFGLSRQLFEYTNYIKKQQSPLPWKWLAIECLQDMRFSVKSDVWAYSILLYEIFSLGHVPYPGYSYNDEFLDALVEGKRPNRPAFASLEVYACMERCWGEDSNQRPSFKWVKEFFDEQMRGLVPNEILRSQEDLKVAQMARINYGCGKGGGASVGAGGEEEEHHHQRRRRSKSFSINFSKQAGVLFHRN